MAVVWVPHEVPVGPRIFVNRAAESSRLEGLFSRGDVVVVVCTGLPGVGKTALIWRTVEQEPGGSGKLRKLGIPTVTDRVVQAALKLVLEPIFETDFQPVSYGSGPSGGRRTMRSPTSSGSGRRDIAGSSTLTSRRVSTRSITRP